MGLTKNRENFEFFGKISPKGQIPWAIFTKLGATEGCPRSVPSRQISPSSLLKCGLSAAFSPKIADIGNFLYKFSKKEYTP